MTHRDARAFAPDAEAGARSSGPEHHSQSTRTMALEMDGAAVRIGGRRLWSDVALTIPGGEFVAVLGPNGAGKSTLVRAILGLVPLAAGTMKVLGRRPGQANGKIGYLPQRRSFDPSVRVRGIDLVWLGLTGGRWGVPLPFVDRFSRRAAVEAGRVREMIELVGAADYATRPIGQVSGGEQQRLLIAQALVRQPAMILLDEPLDSLDLPNQGAVASLIQRICKEHGITVLLVAHDVNPVLPYLDRVIYIARGRAVVGSPTDVITSESLSRLYGTPIEVLRTSDGRLVVVGQPEAPLVSGDRPAHPEHRPEMRGRA